MSNTKKLSEELREWALRYQDCQRPDLEPMPDLEDWADRAAALEAYAENLQNVDGWAKHQLDMRVRAEAERDVLADKLRAAEAERDKLAAIVDRVREYAHGWYPPGMEDFTKPCLLAITDGLDNRAVARDKFDHIAENERLRQAWDGWSAGDLGSWYKSQIQEAHDTLVAALTSAIKGNNDE